MSNMGFSLNADGGLRFSAVSDFEKSKKYTDEEIKIKSISVNGETITPDEDKNVEIEVNAFDGVITSTVLKDKANCPRTKGIFKVVNDNNSPIGRILISGGTPTSAELANTQMLIITNGYPINYIRYRRWDSTNNKWGDWEIIRPRNVENVSGGLLDVSLNTIYSIDTATQNSSVLIRLPEAQAGDFVQYDFVTGSTPPPVYIDSAYGMTEFDFTPEANKIYSLFFDWGIIGVSDGANVYGWRISYAEYDYKGNSSGAGTSTGEVITVPDEDL